LIEKEGVQKAGKGGEGTRNFDGKTKFLMGILLRVSRRIICRYQGSGEV
jgi:hypothetical protein